MACALLTGAFEMGDPFSQPQTPLRTFLWRVSNGRRSIDCAGDCGCVVNLCAYREKSDVR